MYTVEDLLEKLNAYMQNTPKDDEGTPIDPINSPWDRTFIDDVSGKTKEGNTISTEQAKIALKLIDRYGTQLETSGVPASVVDQCVKSPTYRNQPYTSVKLPREARYIGDRMVAFRSKYNPNITRDLKKAKTTNPFAVYQKPYFNRTHKIWIVQVFDDNLEKTMNIIQRYKFEFDETLENFFLDCTNALDKKSSVKVDGDELVVEVNNNEWLALYIEKFIEVEENV